MILLSNGGTNIQRAAGPSDTIVVGTVDGVAILARTDKGWAVKHRALQGVFVSDREVNSITKHWLDQTGGRTFYDELILAFSDAEDGGNGDGGQFGWLRQYGVDEMTIPAAELVMASQRASTSMLQTKLKLGFARASRVMDELERYGIIGPQDPRNPATPRQISAMVRREIFDTLATVRHELHRHQPPAVASRHERAVDIGHENGSDRAAVDDARQVGFEDDVHPVLQDARTMPADAHCVPDGALRTVRANQVLRAHTALRTGRPIANPRDDLVTRLREAHEFRVEAHVCTVPFGVGTQNRFELILIAGGGSGWTDVAGVSRRHPLPRHLGVGQVFHPGD